MPRAVPAKPSPPALFDLAVTHPSATQHLFVGTSGWAYSSWKPGFYPATVRAKQFLSYYASKLTSVEVNYTFRTLPTATQLADWVEATGDGFRFSFKAPQRITHFSRLRECGPHVEEFLAALAPARKAGKLGALLFQLPPNFKANPQLLADFLKLRCLRGPKAPQIAFEFRHESWFSEDIYALLRKADAALCIAESEDLVTPDVSTASFRYHRLRHPGGYTQPRLKAFAQQFASLSSAEDTYVYFKHEEEPTGALHAATMLQFASQETAQ